MTSPKQASTERQAKLLGATVRVAKSIASILDPQELLEQMVTIICDEFEFYYAGVFLLDGSNDWAVLKAGYGEAGTAMIAKDHKLKVGGNSMIGASVATRKARIALDVGEEKVFFSNPDLPDTRSEMALPLMVGRDVLGAITVQSVEEAAFTQEDISTLQSLADQLAIAIDNANQHRNNQVLLQQAERNARLLEAANQVGRGVSSILDIDELLPKTVDIICEAYNFYYAGVFLTDGVAEFAVLRAGRGHAGVTMMAEGHKLKIGGNSMIGMAVALREARISLDVNEEDAFFRNPHLPKTRSEMALPLCVSDRCLGAVTVQSVEGGAFSDNDIQTLQTMADHLAIAINNAELIQALERAHAELLRSKTYEALSAATTEAIHWIGNKALPITTTAVRMQADLDDPQLDAESLKEDLALIDESARLIVEIKENLLGPAREQEPRPTILSDIWSTAAFYTGVPADALHIKSTTEMRRAYADSTQLTRAFGNLLRNALEAGANQINIEVEPANRPGYVMTRISDNGKGIKPEDINQIWASFFTTKGIEHHGLGLSACLHIIGQLNGSINVSCMAGKGTTFSIELPAAGDSGSADFSAAPASVAIIAPDGEWANFAEQVLTSAGKSIAPHAKAGVILLDDIFAAEKLPKLGEAAQKTLIVSPAPKVEKITAYLQAGVKDVALKPYTAQELAKLIS
jgi:K+-sensing histidine kinase KdpD